jgi:hypothetical protein
MLKMKTEIPGPSQYENVIKYKVIGGNFPKSKLSNEYSHL